MEQSHTQQKEESPTTKGADVDQLRQEEIFSYDTSRYDFRGMLQKIFDFEDLSQLHKLVPESSEPNYLKFENDQATWYHKHYYNSPHLPELLALYEKFVKEVIAPMFKSRKLVYQRKPTFRIHLPNNLAVGQKHRDGDYHHPPGEINFWLPFTKVFGNNGFWVETQPDKGDFHNLGK